MLKLAADLPLGMKRSAASMSRPMHGSEGTDGAVGMAAAKRALIVDDSRSARTFLSRILERYEIQVDNAESAEQAIDYLGHHRPDVIFMDHMMPGMDGFQAVQAIKNNPRTATIPILMYTSQEGELYLGQARALGAVGVLPKQIRPTDVSKVLYQLHLLPDRRTLEQSSFRPVSVAVSEAIEAAEQTLSRPLTDSALREHFAELRRVLVASFDSQAERLRADLRAVLHNAPAPDVGSGLAPTRARIPSWAPWATAGAAALVALIALILWAQERGARRALQAQIEQSSHVMRAQSAAPSGAASPGAASDVHPSGSMAPRRAGLSADLKPTVAEVRSPSDWKTIVQPVPYGEDPLGGSRLDALRELFDRLAAQGYHGSVEIRTYPGRFCLMGNTSDGFSLAPDETIFTKCDLVGAPGETMSQPQRLSLTFANLLAELRKRTRGAVDVQIQGADVTSTVVPYPPVSDALTAGEWNRAGAANNRLEVRVH
jgi:CheY-like chemotaxis protein